MIIVYLYEFFKKPEEISTTLKEGAVLLQKDSDFQRLVQSEQLHTSEEKVLHLRLYTNIENGGRLHFKVDYL